MARRGSRSPRPARAAGVQRRPGAVAARPRRERSELRSRVLVAIPALVAAAFVVSTGGALFAVSVALLGLVCLHELFRMYAPVRPVRLAGMLALIAMALGAHLGGERYLLLALAATPALVFLVALAMPQATRLTASMSLTVLGATWIGVGVGHALLLRELPHGGGIVVDVLVGTFVGDSAAYLGGRAFGTRKLAPRVSPNKTVEGLGLGILAAILGTWVAGLYQDWLGHGEALLLGLAVGLAAPVGDLLESKVKRDAQRKDSGGLFGAHGGALDRLDALLLTLPVGYWVWLALL